MNSFCVRRVRIDALVGSKAKANFVICDRKIATTFLAHAHDRSGYLTQQGMALPPDFDWTDDPATSKRLIEAIQAYPDSGVRDKVVAGLHVSTQLGHPRGKQAMFQATTANKNSAALVNLIGCQSDIHRAFWLFVHHLDLFEQAAEMEYVDSHTQHAQQHDLGIKVPVRRDPASMAAFGDAIKGFYQKELGCGEACVAHLLDRAQGTQLVTVHAKDLAMMRLEFDGTVLQRRVGSPNIHMTLEYSDATGVVRTLIRGGAKYHEMLAQAFACHLLGVDVAAQRIKPPTLDLSTLKLGFQVPQAAADGFVTLQVKSITLMSPDTKLKAEFTAMATAFGVGSGNPARSSKIAAGLGGAAQKAGRMPHRACFP